MESIPLLDKGSVGLLDYMGSDQRICQTARISTSGADQDSRTEAEDKRLIDYLMRNDHTSPFEQVLFTFHIKAPIFVVRQWLRHRTARVNEISGRYVEMATEFYVPETLRQQATSNHQGSIEEAVEHSADLRSKLVQHQEIDKALYEELLGEGVARELSRINLPLATYTEWFWNIDLHNLFHFLRLRLHPHAQYEIREYAAAILKLISPIVPWAVEAWKRHKLNGVSLSVDEVAVFKTLLTTTSDEALREALGKRGVRILKEKLGL